MKKTTITRSIEQIRAEAAALEAAMEAEYLASLVSDETPAASIEGDEDAVDAAELEAMQSGGANFDAMNFFKNF